MDIVAIIRDQLVKNEIVAINGFGTFMLHYAPAELYRFTNRVVPPAYTLLFTEDASAGGLLLPQAVADAYNVTIDGATAQIHTFVAHLKQQLEDGATVSLEDMGSLHSEAEKLVFTVDKNSTLLAGSFGLESARIPIFEAESVVEKPAEPVVEKATPRATRVRLKHVVIALALCVLAVVLYILVDAGMVQKCYDAIASLAVHKKEMQHQLATNDTLTGKADANVLKRKALGYEENVVPAKTNVAVAKVITYYIIAGSFKSDAKAGVQKERLAQKGYIPQILNFGDTTFRVSIGSFTDRQKAVDNYIAITAKDSNLNIWLFSRAE